MSDKLKILLSVVIGLISAVVLFCLVVIICCSVNGLTFSEQICEWFSTSKADKVVEQAMQIKHLTTL